MAPGLRRCAHPRYEPICDQGRPRRLRPGCVRAHPCPGFGGTRGDGDRHRTVRDDGVPRPGTSGFQRGPRPRAAGERRPGQHQGLPDERHDVARRGARAHHQLERLPAGEEQPRESRREGRPESPGRHRLGRMRRRKSACGKRIECRSRGEHSRGLDGAGRGREQARVPHDHPVAAHPRREGGRGAVRRRARGVDDDARRLQVRRIRSRQLRRRERRPSDPRRCGRARR